MKNLDISALTIEEVKGLTNCIWIRSIDGESEFSILKDHLGNLFYDIDDAIYYVRLMAKQSDDFKMVGLATYKQACMDNCQWDSL